MSQQISFKYSLTDIIFFAKSCHHFFHLIDPSVKEDLGVNTKLYFCTSLQIYLTVRDCSHSHPAYICMHRQFSSTAASFFFLTLTCLSLPCNLFLNLVHSKQQIILFPSKGQKILTSLKPDISNQKDLTQMGFYKAGEGC